MPYEKIGFIGLGQMGQGMAINLFRGTGQLEVYDQQPAACRPLADMGAEVAVSARQLIGECDLVFLCLPSAVEVTGLLFGDTAHDNSGLLPNSRATGTRHPDGLTIIDTTTLPGKDAIRFALECKKIDVDYFDCPVSGLPKRADEGTLTLMFGGTGSAFSSVQHYLEMMGKDAIHCGDTGSGQSMKTVNNIIYNINIAALCEVIPLALQSGLENDAIERVVCSGSSRSFASEHFVPKMRKRIFDGDFSMQGAYKDIENFRQLINDAGTNERNINRDDLPVSNAMAGKYREALDAGYGDSAKSSMLKLYESLLGKEFT